MSINSSENIVALATPPGLGALAVVRISGYNLHSTYKDFSHKNPIDRRAVFSKIYHPVSKKLLDEAVIIYFKSPNSFTGEDVIEISCHGGEVVPRSIIMAAIDYGARNADPGEFSFRAFLNGKIDLLQAEAISSLVSSKSTLSADISLQHLLGRVSTILSEIRVEALNVLAVIENELDFSEDELDLTSYDEICSRVLNIKQNLVDILNSSTFGMEALSGLRVVLLGKPNSGKSSLFNAVLGLDRAIVSSTPGTTRDTVESYFELDGISVCLIDTAGVWESDDFLDQLSVQKTMSAIQHSDIYFLIDEKDPSILLKYTFPDLIKSRCILIKSKCDLNGSSLSSNKSIYPVSAKNGSGIDTLLTYLSTYISENINEGAFIDRVLITHRQRALLESSLSVIDVLLKQIDEHIETDVLASGIRGFVENLKDVVGEVYNEDVLNNIFSNFCVGK